MAPVRNLLETLTLTYGSSWKDISRMNIRIVFNRTRITSSLFVEFLRVLLEIGAPHLEFLSETDIMKGWDILPSKAGFSKSLVLHTNWCHDFQIVSYRKRLQRPFSREKWQVAVWVLCFLLLLWSQRDCARLSLSRTELLGPGIEECLWPAWPWLGDFFFS